MHVQLFEDNFEVIVLTNCDLVDGIHHAANNLHDIFYENKTGNVTLPPCKDDKAKYIEITLFKAWFGYLLSPYPKLIKD